MRSGQLHLAHEAYVNLFHRSLDQISLLYLKRKMPVRETLLWLRHNAFPIMTNIAGNFIVHWAESGEVMVAGRHGLDLSAVRWQPRASRPLSVRNGRAPLMDLRPAAR